MVDALKLHLGCGKIRLPGYVNVDILAQGGADVIADLRALPVAAGSVSLIYSCAAIEHFGRREWQPLLAYWLSLLKPGGLLRLSTMDFEACGTRYGRTGNLSELLGLLIGGQKDEFDWHGMLFDFATLKAGLEGAGFVNVRRYDWRQTEIGRLGIDDFSQAYLPHMDKENGQLMMLNVEADKRI
jgi:hypothetical protein